MGSRAVVLVSGVLSHTPFTTPDAACTTGFAASNTHTFLRQWLLDHGVTVFTAPQRTGSGPVTETDDPFDGPFGACPAQPSESMTVDTTARVDLGGERLHAFVTHLHDTFGITEIDLIGHSMGGPLSRALIGAIAVAGGPVEVRSLTTIGSPWAPPMLKEFLREVPTLTGHEYDIVRTFAGTLLAARPATDAVIEQLTVGYEEWAESLAWTLDDLPVTLIGGSAFDRDGGDPDLWPNDGAIQLAATTAVDVPDRLLPDRTVHVLPLTHSLFVSEMAGLDASTALTWSPEVGALVVDALRTAGWTTA
ncbi:MAG: alpha/beta hydrolase [Acidimicrobiia bacterium]|nr:alpha/beta hydrolase [Acidimicrobiia bacterium]